jgi:CRP/FNR family cyclic AMP-dependent transcriptional regulator
MDQASAGLAMLGEQFLFAGLRPQELDQIMSVATEQRYARGQTIFQRGDPGTSLITVLEGRVRISACSEEGKEVTLGIMGPGDVFGEIAAIDGRERTADATAIGPCCLLVLDRREVLPVLERHARIAVRLLQILCARMRNATNACQNFALLDVPVRLARLLRELAETHGETVGGGRRLTLKLSQRELGNLIGATRESVNKHLRAWEAEGLISIDHGRITLHDPGKIEEQRSCCSSASRPALGSPARLHNRLPHHRRGGRDQDLRHLST